MILSALRTNIDVPPASRSDEDDQANKKLDEMLIKFC
jgi:hypothetical protein